MVILHRDLFDILRGYSGLLAPKHMVFPRNLSFNEIHNFLVDSILLALNLPHLQAYPPSEQYQYSFWKWAIQHLEDISTDEDTEIDDRIYAHFMTLFSPPSMGVYGTSGPPIQSHVTQYWKAEASARVAHTMIDTSEYRNITSLQSRTTVESGTTALRTWLASQVLAQYLTKHPGFITSKRVLELGSGIGFLGSIVASLQMLHCPQSPGNLWLTDINDEALARCKYNVQLPCNTSSSHPSVYYRSLDWSDALDSGAPPLQSFLQDEVKADLVLGADLVFDPALIPALVGTLYMAMQSGPALIALTVRNDSTLALFVGAAEMRLSVKELDFQSESKMFLDTSSLLDNDMDVKIFLITKKG